MSRATRRPRIALMMDRQWPYKRHADVLAGSVQYAQEKNWEVILDDFADHTLPNDASAPSPYDGIIARASSLLLQRAPLHNVPVVNVWYSSPVWEAFPGIFPDYSAIGKIRAEHLLARGFRRFATLINDGNRGHNQEVQAFTATVQAEGYTNTATQIPTEPAENVSVWRRVEKTISQWMDAWVLPIGVYVGSEVEGRMVIQMCRNRGWRMPQDVALISGYNEESICGTLHPTITSVDVDYERIGMEASKLLERLMQGRQPTTLHTVISHQQLVVGESTDFYAVNDPVMVKALQYIATNSHRDIGPDDVAAALEFETRTLQRHFNRFLNRPIATEIRRVRIERAKRELLQNDRPIKDIAVDVGFGDSLQMYKVFQRELGMTPSAFRQQQRS